MANEVFGFGNWDAETVEMNRGHEPVQIPSSEEHPKGGIVVTYSARDGLRVLRLDALGQLRLRPAKGFAQFAALPLELVQRDEAAWMRARLRLGSKGCGEGVLAFENEPVQSASLGGEAAMTE